METKYKAGDIVRIKSKEWYDKNKNKFGKVWTSSYNGEHLICFDQDMAKYCGKAFVIASVEPECYALVGVPYAWTDEMIEGTADEETVIQEMQNDGIWQEVYLACVRINRSEDQPLQGLVLKAMGRLMHEEPFLCYDQFRYCGQTVDSMVSYDEYYTSVGPEERSCIVLQDFESAVKEIFVKIRMFTVAERSMSWLDFGQTEVNDDITPDVFFIDDTGEETLLDPEWVENLLTEDEKKLLGLYVDSEAEENMFNHVFGLESEEEPTAMARRHIPHDDKDKTKSEKAPSDATRYLFRGKDFETDEWIQGSYFDHKGYYPEIVTIYPDDNGKAAYCHRCVKPETLCIWSGVTDCKGRKIFSHDILAIRICRYRNPDGEEGWETEYISAVGDMANAFSVDLPEGEDFDMTSLMWLSEYAYADVEVEVIGNTFDNPELQKNY